MTDATRQPTHQAPYTVRIVCLIALLLIGFLAVSIHLYRVQVLRHPELHEKAKALYTASKLETGTRGVIMDAHGHLLAGNLACRDVYVEPRLLHQQLPFAIRFLAQQLEIPRGVVFEKLAKSFRDEKPQVEVILAKGIEISKAEAMAAELAKQKVHGIRFVDSNRRYYPKKSLVSNLLGFVDAEGKGVAGVENLLDKQLEPKNARQVFERDRRGSKIDYDAKTAAVKPRDGSTVYLTIDEVIQQYCENELAKLVQEHAPRAAYAVMANPKTGAILAWAQVPSFDPNDRSHMNPEHWKNRVLVEGFEPGSIMKAVSLCGALDYGIVNLDTAIDCEDGHWFYAGRSLRDSGHRYGTLQVRNIIQKSSNIGTAKVAVMLGPQRLDATFRRFGFGTRTGIGFVEKSSLVPTAISGFSDESPGIYRKLAKWDGLSVTRFPIGQGVLVTPLQMVQAYCALANHGVMYQLNIIDAVEDPASGIREVTPPRIKSVVVDHPEAVERMVSALELVTQEGGTATKAAVPGFAVAGKTGTAQKVVNGQYASKYISSFIGFVPAEDPAFVLLVAADEPTKGGYYGGTVAAPVFSRIAVQTLRYLESAPAKVPFAAPTEPAPGAAPAGTRPGPATAKPAPPDATMPKLPLDRSATLVMNNELPIIRPGGPGAP